MTSQQIELGLKLLTLAQGTFPVIGPEMERFILDAVQLAIEVLKPQTVVVEAQQVTVDLAGLQNHESGGA